METVWTLKEMQTLCNLVVLTASGLHIKFEIAKRSIKSYSVVR